MKDGKRNFRGHRLLLVVFTVLLLARPVAAALTLPAPTTQFYAYDEMGVLSSSTTDEILKTNIELEGKTKAQVVVATVNDLQGYPVEDYALELFRQWGIGDKKLNNGVLILLGYEPTTDQYGVFIATGYGLEGQLNDGKVGRILDEYFMPLVDRDNPQSFDRALQEVFRAVISQVIAEYDVELTGDYQKYTDTLNESTDINWFPIVIFVIFVVLAISKGPRGPRGRRRRYSRYPYGGGFGGFGGGFGGGSSGGSSGGFGGFSGGGGSSGGGGAGRSF